LIALVLFQFLSVQFALGYNGRPATKAQVRTGVASKTKPLVKLQMTNGAPVRLEIPSIKVEATIDPVGLTSDGAMGIPDAPQDTAWYMLGPKPGETGSAVISGHLNWWYGATGVFARLSSLKIGDLVTVQDDQGVNTSFVVRRIRSFGQKEDATEVFFANDDGSHLNLVTCAGVWDKLLQRYSKRLVIFTDKVTE